MGRKSLQLLQGEFPEINKRYYNNVKYSEGIRVQVLQQISLGKSRTELSLLFNISTRTIQNWINRFNVSGLEGLKDKHHTGRPPLLSVSQNEELKTIILNKTPLEFTYNTGTWTGALVRDLILRLYQIEIKTAQIYNILRKMGLSYQKSKGFYPETHTEKREIIVEDIKKNSK